MGKLRNDGSAPPASSLWASSAGASTALASLERAPPFHREAALPSRRRSTLTARSGGTEDTTAASLAARFEQAFGVTPELVPGGGGIFDVDVDGERVWSKHVEGDFPDEDALIERLRG